MSLTDAQKEIERLSQLLAEAREEHRLCTGKLIAAAGRIVNAEEDADTAERKLRADTSLFSELERAKGAIRSIEHQRNTAIDQRDRAAAANTPLFAVVYALKQLSEEECENGIEAVGETCAFAEDEDPADRKYKHWCGPCIAKAILGEHHPQVPAVTGTTSDNPSICKLSGSAVDAPEAPKASEIAPDSSALEKALGALRELLRLYDWRFELAKRENDPERTVEHSVETRRLLRQYGTEKKAAWAAARTILSGGAHADAPQAPKDLTPEPEPTP